MEFTHVSATATAACGGAASNHTGGQRSSSQESEAISDVMEQEPAGGQRQPSLHRWCDKISEVDAHLALPYVKEPVRLFMRRIDRAKAVEQNYKAIYT